VRARQSWAAVAATLGALAFSTSAGAATQIGETFVPPDDCTSGITFLQTTSPGGQYLAPSSGVITSWSFQASPSPPQVKFKVGRPQGGTTFMIVGESSFKTPVPNALNTYTDVAIPMQAGDVIGSIYQGVAGNDCFRQSLFHDEHYFDGDPPPGTSATFQPEPEFQLDVSATLEPDCDSDGLGDESQDTELPLGEACGKGSRSVSLDANKNKLKKGKKVLLSGRISSAARQGPCESSQTVELQRKRPKQTTFTTFAQVQTDAQGGFSLKKKLKKTFEFRAQVVETAACTAALSNSEKVKVKKKK
jgi:hypothetical protein